MLNFIKHGLLLGVIIGVLVGITIYADMIRQTIAKEVAGHFTDVKGISTQVNNSSFSQSIKDQAQKDASEVTKQVLQLRVGDVINVLQRGQKIITDMQGVQRTVNQQLEKLK